MILKPGSPKRSQEETGLRDTKKKAWAGGGGKREGRTCWEAHFSQLFLLTRQGAAPIKTSTGSNFLENTREILKSLHRWPQRESERFARIDAQIKHIFTTFERCTRIASNLLFASFSAKEGVQLGNPQAIHENQVIRENLRIDSSEWGHRSHCQSGAKFGEISDIHYCIGHFSGCDMQSVVNVCC